MPININTVDLEHCIKCNLCTEVCPMYEVNPLYPGPKQSGPDGERYRLKTEFFFDESLKYCLNCKRCEVVCPSAVPVGDIIALAKLNHGYRSSHGLRDKMLASTDFVGSLASPFAGIVNPLLRWGLSKRVLDTFFAVTKERSMPAYSSRKFTSWYKSNEAERQKDFTRSVYYFHGCYVNYNYPQLGRDFVTLLNACGYGVKLLDKEKCCGVALIANGFKDKARKQAEININAMREAGATVLTSSSTCTFTMRDEYESILGLDTSDVKENLQMTVKWLYDKVESGEVKLAFRPEFRMRAAYHTPCHLQKMGWQHYSIALLRMIPGLELDVLEQNCCGIAGTFGFKKENYNYSKEIGQKLFKSIAESGADVVITDCETCKWQIEQFTDASVLNPISVLVSALDIEATTKLNNI